MDETKYIWMDGQFVPWQEAKIHVLSHSLHYGDAVFEGIRFYQTKTGSAIFRLKDHTHRLFYSASVLKMKVPYTEDQINQVMVELIQKNQINEGYLRPIIIYGYGKMGLKPTGAALNMAIACWPWPAYLSTKKSLPVIISKYIRIHPQTSEVTAKISGHYVNSILATMEADAQGVDEAIFLDYQGNIAEGPVQNLFMVKDKVVIAPRSDSILPGITRDCVLRIAQDLNFKVAEKPITPNEFKQADECFFSGTAMEVMAISQVDKQVIGGGGEGEVTKKIKEVYKKAARGEVGGYEDWLTRISSQE